jgi:hypothetical protein
VPPSTGRPGARGLADAIGGARLKVLATGVVIVAAVAAGYLARGRVVPAEGPVSSSPSPGAESTPPPAKALDRVAGLFAGPKTAHVSLDFAHSLKGGTLRVLVDDEAVIVADLDSRVTRRIAGVSLRKGTLLDSFEVEPGRHEIRVRVAWDGNAKDESIWANFQPGSKRRLEARLRGVGGLQDLSLKWR